jgi:pyridoxamine 5'-phosphate oxidase
LSGEGIGAELPLDPLRELGAWIEEARERDLPHPAAATFATVDAEGRPSARTVTLKRLEADSLIFSSALWTRKARDLAANPHVSLLFFWPQLGRQAHVAGTVAVGSRDLADALFAERDPLHQVQALVSRQGEPIEAEELERMRARSAHLVEVAETSPQRPEDWGALVVTPAAVELWEEAADRIHERRLFERAEPSWTVKLLAP